MISSTSSEQLIYFLLAVLDVGFDNFCGCGFDLLSVENKPVTELAIEDPNELKVFMTPNPADFLLTAAHVFIIIWGGALDFIAIFLILGAP